ncbi:MAG: Crp/Fnr family transcriptional regulator [Acidobacteria bacterium]|nr:Crp/Fnr family transcriptional regulator [Acidobacteriota bacterium]
MIEMDWQELLQQQDLFHSLDAAALASLAVEGRRQTLAPGEALFWEDEEGDHFYLLLSGTVRLFKTAPDGREITVKLVRPGEMFAEVILFESDRYPVSATAAVASEVLAVPRRRFLRLLEDPAVRRRFVAGLMRKMRYLTDRILYLTTYDVEERFYGFLRENYGIRERYPIPLSKKDIAAAIGTIPETFSRLIQRLKQRGIIRWDDELVFPRRHWPEEWRDE